MSNKCVDCGIEITKNAKRCKLCNMTGENNLNYKHGKSKNNHCIDCGRKIHRSNKRCRQCYLKFNKGKNHHSYIDGRTKKKNKCTDCEKEIGRNSIRCKKCYQIFSKGENPPAFKHGRGCKDTKHYCIDCGVQIGGGAYGTSKRCKSCATKRIPIDFPGIFAMENNPNWKYGISFETYSPEFNKQLKEEIRTRDNYTCQIRICRKKQEKNSKRLSVHHIDYDKKNNNKHNLITLCNSCHMKTNVNRSYWKDYFTKMMYKKISQEFVILEIKKY